MLVLVTIGFASAGKSCPDQCGQAIARLSTQTCNSTFQTIANSEQFSLHFIVDFRMVVNSPWSLLQTATSCTVHNVK